MARKIKNRRAKTTVALVGNGQTERIYFANLRDTDRPDNLDIFPDYPRKSVVTKVFLNARLS